jgi:hypothetical protein
MGDRQNLDTPAPVIDAVHDPVVAPVGAVHAFELEPERSSETRRGLLAGGP